MVILQTNINILKPNNMTQGKADKQAGEKLFNALRELEVQFLNGGYSVQTSAQKLLRDHGYTPANQMAKYLIAQSILKKDEQNSTHKKPYYWYNGPKLSVKYCNSLILQMKLDRSASKKPKTIDPRSIGLEIEAPSETIKHFDEKVEAPKENPFPIDKDPDGRDRNEIDLNEINYARIKELDAEVFSLKEFLDMRDVEIDNLKGRFEEAKRDFEKSIEIQVELSTKLRDQKKKYKKLKKLIKAIL